MIDSATHSARKVSRFLELISRRIQKNGTLQTICSQGKDWSESCVFGSNELSHCAGKCQFVDKICEETKGKN